jgi:membrane protease YdiL (CAAX protease family)
VILAGYIIWREQAHPEGGFSLKKLARFINGDGLGYRTTWHWYYVPLALGLGFLMSLVEFAILGPGALIPDAGFLNLLTLMVVMVVFIGFGEELVFRALLQSRAEPWIGIYGAVLLSAFLFSVMHSGYSSIPYLIFVFAVGLVLAFIYVRTRSLALVAMIHGFLNFFLFSFLPLGWNFNLGF